MHNKKVFRVTQRRHIINIYLKDLLHNIIFYCNNIKTLLSTNKTKCDWIVAGDTLTYFFRIFWNRKGIFTTKYNKERNGIANKSDNWRMSKTIYNISTTQQRTSILLQLHECVEKTTVFWLLIKLGSVNYPCRGFLRPCDKGKVNRVTSPSGPNTDDGILSSESDKDFVSADCSCKLHLIDYTFRYFAQRMKSVLIKTFQNRKKIIIKRKTK